MKKMSPIFPSDEEINILYQKYHTPNHIRKHQEVVASIATFLAKELYKKGFEVNIKLTRAGALLHDIGKIYQLDESKVMQISEFLKAADNKHHAVYGQRIMENEGFPEVGRLVGLHLGSKYMVQPELFINVEEKLIMLGDMRVIDQKIVTIDERIAYIEERYGLDFKTGKQTILEIQKEIFSSLKLEPSLLYEVVKHNRVELK